jgi:hypothetical protein
MSIEGALIVIWIISVFVLDWIDRLRFASCIRKRIPYKK